MSYTLFVDLKQRLANKSKANNQSQLKNKSETKTNKTIKVKYYTTIPLGMK